MTIPKDILGLLNETTTLPDGTVHDSIRAQGKRTLQTMLATLPAGAHADYTKAHNAAVEAMAEEKNPAIRARMKGYYNRFLGQYAQFALESHVTLQNAMQTRAALGHPMTAHEALSHAKAASHGYWTHFYDTAPNPAYAGRYLTLSQLHALGGDGVGYHAFQKLGDKMRGPNALLQLVYDEKAAKDTDSTLGGVKWGGILGGIAGFFAGRKLLPVDGVMNLVLSLATALGGAAAGGWISGWLNKKPPEPEAVLNGIAAGGGAVNLMSLNPDTLKAAAAGMRYAYSPTGNQPPAAPPPPVAQVPAENAPSAVK